MVRIIFNFFCDFIDGSDRYIVGDIQYTLFLFFVIFCADFFVIIIFPIINIIIMALCNGQGLPLSRMFSCNRNPAQVS